MQHSPRPLPGWFRALFVTVMLLLCAFLGWYAVSQYQLHFELSDVALSLSTSRQREAKQRFEYNEVAKALPEAQAETARLIPLAEAALATETDLRAQRKVLRQENAELSQQLTELQAEVANLTALANDLQTAVEALSARRDDLEKQLDEK